MSVSGATGRARTGTLKITVSYRDGFIGEGQISYTGSGAAARAQLTLDIVKERLAIVGVSPLELRFEIIGVNALSVGGADPVQGGADVRARVVGRTQTLREAECIGREIEAVWINGPAGGGGASWSAREVLAAGSVLLPREQVRARVMVEVS